MRKHASDAPAGPAPTIKRSVSSIPAASGAPSGLVEYPLVIAVVYGRSVDEAIVQGQEGNSCSCSCKNNCSCNFADSEKEAIVTIFM